jgi:hypothetical protein
MEAEVMSVKVALFIPLLLEHMFVYSTGMQAWEAHDPALTRPIAAPLERCAELLGVDLDAIQEAAAHVEPYLRVDGTKVWSLMQLERHLRPDAYSRVRGGYIARRRPRTAQAVSR